MLLVVLSSVTATGDELMLGFYDRADTSGFEMLADAGFEYVIPYGLEGRKESYIEKYLGVASRCGVNVIFSVKDCHKRSKWFPKVDWCHTDDPDELVGCIAKRFDGHEAVWGWYMADEPSVSWGKLNWPQLGANSRSIRRNSSKPIVVSDKPFRRAWLLWGYLSGLCDVLMTHTYPIPDRSVVDVWDAARGLSKRYKKPLIVVVQVHGKHQYAFTKTDEISGRLPTMNEIRVMSYLAAMGGADGIFYYSLFDFRAAPGFEERWRFLSGLARELKADHPIISSQEKVSARTDVAKNDGVYASVRCFEGTNYLVIVNSTPEPQVVETSFSGGTTTVELSPLDARVLPLRTEEGQECTSLREKSGP